MRFELPSHRGWVSAARWTLVSAALWAAAAVAEPLIGLRVGNADTLISEGSKLFNRKDYKKAAESFLRATRVNPATTATYAQLARAYVLSKQLTRGCYAYRVYLKVTPDGPDRKKAAAEADQCERQLKSAKKQPPDPTQRYVELRAAFFASLDSGALLGAESADSSLRTLVSEGFLGPELAEMGAKLGAAAVAQADAIHRRAVSLEQVSAEALRSARPLYQLASDVGTSPADTASRMAYLDGLAELSEKAYRRAEQLFSEAAKADPSNGEYHYARAVALVQAGDRAGALKVLESALGGDPRTAVIRAAVALSHSAESGAAELERLLFTSRYPPDK